MRSVCAGRAGVLWCVRASKHTGRIPRPVKRASWRGSTVPKTAVTSRLGVSGLILLIVAVAVACLPDSPSSPQSPQEALSAGATRAAELAPPTATAFVIEYVVSGDMAGDEHLVNVRWHSASGPDEIETKVNVADGVWSRFVTVKPGSELLLEVSNSATDDDRPVRCEIYLSGQLWDSLEAEGAGANAACSAIAGW